MKKTLLLFALFYVPFLLFSQAVLIHSGQSYTTQSVNRAPNGTSSHAYFRGSTIVLASELTSGIPASTNLTVFGFMLNSGASSAVSGNLKVYMSNTTSTTYANGNDWATISGGMTLVYDGNYTIPVSTVPTPIDVTLNTPFLYSGSALYVAYEWSSVGPFATTGATYQCNNSLSNGLVMAPSATALPATLTTTTMYRPCMRFGYVNPFTTEGLVTEVYTMGKLPIPFGTPHTVQAYIKNQGAATLYNYPATLTITGANNFTDVVTFDSLLPGVRTLVTFNSFTPSNLGMNNITVSVPADQNNINNSITKTNLIHPNTYSYSQGSTPSGGVGFNNNTADFAAKFNTSTSQSLNQVNVRFTSGGKPFQVGIWSVGSTGAPDQVIYSSPTYTSSEGVSTVVINPPITIPAGSFFVGVKQTGTANLSFAYQTENPIRPNCFYFTSPSGGTTWSDFAPNNAFRFMIEPKFAIPNDVSINGIAPSNTSILVAGSSITLQARVINYGTNSQNAVPVYYTVNGGAPVGPVTTTNPLSINDTSTVIFSGANAFIPSSSGSYTVKFFTQLTSDQVVDNDTMSIVYNILPSPITVYPYVENFTNPIGWTTTGALWKYTSAYSPIATVTPDSAYKADFYNADTTVSGMLRTPIFNFTGVTNPKLDFYVAYRTYTIQDDSLQIWVSTDMGQTFVPGSPVLYQKSYTSTPSLSTLNPNVAIFIPSASSDWRLETVDLSQFAGNASIMIAFKGISDNGNNCWIDQVKVYDNVVPFVTTTAATDITPYTVTTGGNVTSEGGSAVTERGVCFSTTQNPTIIDTHISEGSGTGTFSISLMNLTQNTTYYLRAYATNSIGTGYGNEITFSTLVDGITDPTNLGIKIYQMDQLLVIESVKSFESGVLNLYDVNGKWLKSLTIPEGQSKITMNVSDLVKGLYLINITSGTENNGYKVVLK